jgi:hypothetical protein
LAESQRDQRQGRRCGRQHADDVIDRLRNGKPGSAPDEAGRQSDCHRVAIAEISAFEPPLALLPNASNSVASGIRTSV